ncbi:RNase adapter RapZ [Aliiroseovarius sp.]|uniref:RNase adapter RapZ n=1 Tax=Aliiroseovarius sp. TaxID=1872442 RepID=UPI002625E6ED|nr:RNase adapter RapZ [Aliiroseovarius sp.]
MTDKNNRNKEAKAQRIVLVTGASGAGRSTAIRALEDVGYEAIDNLPMSLIERLLDGAPLDHPLVLGIDVRNRDFSVERLLELLDWLRRESGWEAELLYLDCSRDVLIRRFSETRRRHPLAPEEAPGDGILREVELLAPVRARASVLIDTSELSVHDLKEEVLRWLGNGGAEMLAVSVQSFSYKRGMARGLDLMFDARFLRNPHWDPTLRALDGRSPEVAAYVAEDARFDEFFDRVLGMVEFLLPAYGEEGKSHLSIGFGCTGGKHRSVALAEKLANALAQAGWQVSIRHRELELRAEGLPGTAQQAG